MQALQYSHVCKYACSEEDPELLDMGGPAEGMMGTSVHSSCCILMICLAMSCGTWQVVTAMHFECLPIFGEVSLCCVYCSIVVIGIDEASREWWQLVIKSVHDEGERLIL